MPISGKTHSAKKIVHEHFLENAFGKKDRPRKIFQFPVSSFQFPVSSFQFAKIKAAGTSFT